MWSRSSFTIPTVAAISFCVFGGVAPAIADIINVPAEYPTIQAGIDAAVDGDEVVVADGVYAGEGNTNIDFGGRSITVRSENGPGNCIIDCQQARRGFNFNSGETSAAVLDGFTVRNGVGTPGGGIRVFNCSPTLKNVRVELCSAGFGGGMYLFGSSSMLTNVIINGCTTTGNGGGIYFGSSDLTFTNLTVTCCTAGTGGGGIRGIRGSFTIQQNGTITGNTVTSGNGAGILLGNCNGTIDNVNFSNNTAAGFGAGIATFDGTVLNVNNCSFGGDSADLGGGIYSGPGCTTTVTGCSFLGETATFFGGGSTADGANVTYIDTDFTDCVAGSGGGACATSSGSSVQANLCRFAHNNAGNLSANGSGDGGAMFNLGVPATIVDCIFEDNSATRGGAIYNSQCNLQSTNCLFDANTATSSGGAIYNVQSQPQIRLATMWGNAAPFGGGLYNVSSFPTLSNSILRNNTPDQIRDVAGSVTTATYSNIQGGWPGAGNIDANPMFVAPGTGDFHLSPGSPCIDAANNTAVPKGIDTDLDGNPRFVDDPDTKDTGFGDPPIVDMGAYEFQPALCPADLDNSGDVGVKDLLILLGAWGLCKGCPADFDNSGDVGVKDLLFLLGAWGPCP